MREATPVASQCLLKRCQALWRGAALGSHLAAWVALECSYCTLCATRRRMARSMSFGLVLRASRDPFGSW